MRCFLNVLSLISFSASAQLFDEPVEICSLGIFINDILCCDFDGNDYEDILLSPYPYGNLILVMNSESGFSEPFFLSWQGNNMRASDFNGDGLADIATGLAGPLLFSNGDGTFTPSTYNLLASTVPDDFNGDGMPDLLMGSGTDIYLALNQNWGESFETVWSGVLPEWPGVHSTGFITGDIAGNSFTDFAALHSYGLRVFIAQEESTSFNRAETEDDLYTYLSGSPPYAQCDINNDGHPDLVHSGWDIYPSPPPPIYLSIWENNPGAWYWTLSGINANYEPTVEACDFDGDGYDEVLYSNASDVTVVHGTASGPGTVMFSDTDCRCQTVGYGHLAGSANPDLIYCDADYLYWYENNLTKIDTEETDVPPFALAFSRNPFNSSVCITAPFQGSFQIMDLCGRSVATATGSEFIFAPVDLPGGSYIVVFTGQGRIMVKKLLFLPR